MSVIEGEGSFPILFGSLPLPIPPNRSAYLARPDLGGSFPTVVIAHGEAGVGPGVKALSRFLARHGFAVMAPELSREPAGDGGYEWTVSDLADAVAAARTPGTGWASGSRIALLGIGGGAMVAAIVAVEENVPALVLVGPYAVDVSLEGYRGRLLALTPLDPPPRERLAAARTKAGRGRWVGYPGAAAGFLDEGAPGYDPAAASDALQRIISFLEEGFGSAQAA